MSALSAASPPPGVERIVREEQHSCSADVNSSFRVMLITDSDATPCARYLRSRFKHFFTMKGTQRWSAHHDRLCDVRPDILVGGATALALIQKGFWRGPTVLLSPVLVPGVDDELMRLPPDIPVLVVAGAGDALRHIEGFWAMNDTRCRDGLRVHVVSDDHSLSSILDDLKPVHSERLGISQRRRTATSRRAALYDFILECWDLRKLVASGAYHHSCRLGGDEADSGSPPSTRAMAEESGTSGIGWLERLTSGLAQALPVLMAKRRETRGDDDAEVWVV